MSKNIERTSPTLAPSVADAIEAMRAEQGDSFSLENINLSELQRRSGVSRARLRRLKENGFVEKPHGSSGRKVDDTVLSGYESMLDSLLRAGVANSSVCFSRLQEEGYKGSLSTVKNYIKAHKDLVPAKRQQVESQGNRGRRYQTGPGEVFQMDWGFLKVACYDGSEQKVACFAMICHHCGQRYVEFFPNARQENLFIGMIHAFQYMGVPEYVLTDNMASVVTGRDSDGHPIWQRDYEAFMQTVNFKTKVCKARHPFTKGAVERLIRFVKENFAVGRYFYNVTDLNAAALEWCNSQNGKYHKAVDCIPQQKHYTECAANLISLEESEAVALYLCPERKISFDGFVTYESRRFGVPYSYPGKTARVMRKDDVLYIYSADLRSLLTTHAVTWSRKDSFCEGQYEPLSDQPEEFPTTPVKTVIRQLQPPVDAISFEKFNFDREVDWNE